MTERACLPLTVLLMLSASLASAGPQVGPDELKIEIAVDKILGECKDAEDLAACLRDRIEEEDPERYPTIPDRPPGVQRVELSSALLGVALATEWAGTRIQLSHPGHGESVLFGPFESLEVPLAKLKEIHLPAAERECAGAEDPVTCFEEFFDRFKTERYAERFSFIRWGERVEEEPEPLEDPFEAVDVFVARFAVRVKNLHSVIGETGFAALVVPRERAPDRTFVPALHLGFSFDSPQPNVVCTNAGGFLSVGCPDVSLTNVSLAVELLLTVEDGRVTYDRVGARFNSSAPDIRNDADILDEVVAAFVDIRAEMRHEVEEKLSRQFRSERSRDRVARAFTETLCERFGIGEVVALYIDPDDSLVIDGVPDPACAAGDDGGRRRSRYDRPG